MNDSTVPPLPSNMATLINLNVETLKAAIEDGGRNPHIVLRQMLGSAYADGYHSGYTDAVWDKPLDREED